MPLVLPLDSASDRYRLELTLDGVDLGLQVYWLPRAAGWYLDLQTPAGDDISTGVRIAPGSAVAFPSAGDGVPPGVFVALGPASYGREDLGGQVEVAYVTAAEVEAAALVP